MCPVPLCELVSIILSGSTLALVLVEQHLADTHVMRCYLHIFIFLDVLKCLLEAEYYRWGQLGLVVAAGSAHVGQFFRLGDVHHQVAFLAVFAHHLSLVDIGLRFDEEAAPILQLVERVGIGIA